MSYYNSNYCSVYSLFNKLSLLLVCCLMVACNPSNQTKQDLSTENRNYTSESAININTASALELEKLPNVGEHLAREIIEYREKYGKFRKAEHILLVRGFSDERFRRMRNLIKVE